MTDEVRTALAVIVRRGMTDDLVAQAAVVLGGEIGRLGRVEKAYIDAFGEYSPEAHALIRSSIRNV